MKQFYLLCLGFLLVFHSTMRATPVFSKQRSQCGQNQSDVFYLDKNSNEEKSSLSICPYSETQKGALIEELDWIKQHGKSGLWIREAYEISLKNNQNQIHDTIITVCTPQGSIICLSSLLSEQIDFETTDKLGTFSVITPSEKLDHPLVDRILVISPLSNFADKLLKPLSTQETFQSFLLLSRTTASDALILFR